MPEMQYEHVGIVGATHVFPLAGPTAVAPLSSVMLATRFCAGHADGQTRRLFLCMGE